MIQLPMLVLLSGVGYVAYKVNESSKVKAAPPAPAALPVFDPSAAPYDPSGGVYQDPNYSPTVSDSTGSSDPYNTAGGSAYATPAPIGQAVPVVSVSPVDSSKQASTPVAAVTPAATPTTVATTSGTGIPSHPFANPFTAVDPSKQTVAKPATGQFANPVFNPTPAVQTAPTTPIVKTPTKTLSSISTSSLVTSGFSTKPAAAPVANPTTTAPVTKPSLANKGRFAGDNERLLMMADAELGEEGSTFGDWLPTFVTPEDARNYILETDATWFRLAADVDNTPLADNVRASWQTDYVAWQKFRDENTANVGWLNTKATMEATDRWLMKINQWAEYIKASGAKLSGPAPLAAGQGDPTVDKLAGLKMAGIGAAAAVGAIAVAKILTPRL